MWIQAETANTDLTASAVHKQGFNSVSHSSSRGGAKHKEVVIYRPSQAIVRYMVVYRAAKLQTVERQLRFEKMWSSNSGKRQKLSFQKADVEKLIEDTIQGNDSQREKALEELGSLCRDDCKSGARQLDDNTGFWKACVRLLQTSTCEPLHWFVLRLFHNYAYDTALAQMVLHKSCGNHSLLPMLSCANEAVVQKAAIAICNMSQACEPVVSGDDGLNCASELVQSLQKAKENLTKIYIICALRNFLSAENLRPELQDQAFKVVPIVGKVLESDAYKSKMWLDSVLGFFDNLATKSTLSGQSFVTKVEALLSAMEKVFNGHVKPEVAWSTDSKKQFYRCLLSITVKGGDSFWTTPRVRSFNQGIREDLEQMLEDGDDAFFAVQTLPRNHSLCHAVLHAEHGHDSLCTMFGKFVQRYQGCDSCNKHMMAFWCAQALLASYRKSGSSAGKIGGMDIDFLKGVKNTKDSGAWTTVTGSIGGDHD